MPTPSCYEVEQDLIVESGRIGPDIYNETLYDSPWLSLPKEGVWPDEMGAQISTLIYEASLPSSFTAWADVGGLIQSGNESANLQSCIPPKDVVPWAQTLRSYNLQHYALESPPLCLEHLRVTVHRQTQLSNMMDILRQNTAYTLINRNRDEYERVTLNKVIATTGLPTGTTTFPVTQPTWTLSAGILKRLYGKLVRHTGAVRNPLAKVNNAPVFGLIASIETTENLIKNNDDIRQDFHWSNRSNELLEPMGITRPYGEFIYINDLSTPRYNWNGAAFVRVPFYADDHGATYGARQRVSDAYLNAKFEVSYIWHADAARTLTPASNPATGEFAYPAQNYRGQWKWLNIPDKDCNPDSDIGFMRGKFVQGTQPIHPEYGYAIMHLRCDAPLDGAACEADSGYNS